MATENGQKAKQEAQGDRFAGVAMFVQAHEEEGASERRKFSDDPGLNVIQKFTNPDEARTMGRVSKQEAYWASVVYAQGKHTGCTFLTSWIETRMLLSRSEEAWGSNQAADVARTTPREAPRSRGFLGLFGGPR